MDFLYKQRSAQNEYFQSTKALDKLQKFEELRLLYDITISIEAISVALRNNVNTLVAPKYQQQLQSAQAEQDKLLRKFDQTKEQ
jgi:hypothetical protein